MYWKLGIELFNKPEGGHHDHCLTGKDDAILVIPTVLEQWFSTYGSLLIPWGSNDMSTGVAY